MFSPRRTGIATARTRRARTKRPDRSRGAACDYCIVMDRGYWPRCPPWPVVSGGGTVMAGGAVVVAAGEPASLFAVRVPSLLVNTSASITITNTAPAIHPHGGGEPI